jgi:peptidoglycan hydrolase-like protein with peptidoglycan-binding domain
VKEGIFEDGEFKYAQKVSPTVTAKKSPEPSSQVQEENKTPPSAKVLVPLTVGIEKLLPPKVDQQKRLELARRTQEVLQVLGLYSGKLDGIIGARTKSAIQKWQKRNGYSATGEITETQLAKLEQEAVTRLAEKKQKPIPKKVVRKVPNRPDDVAVIIANSNYKKLGKDIPNVDPAYNDATNIKRYFMESLGVREGNIIYLKDATGAQLTEVFGNKENHKAQLFNWVRPNKSNVHIYYAGHGAPASKDGSAYLVPSDAKSQTIEFSGYPLTNLYRNLGKIKARSVTVILEACFSGFSQSGAVLPKSSGIMIVAKEPTVPSNVRVISAGAADQMASWEKNGSQSLFTKYFLKGMSGEGDRKPYGNGDGKVEDTELKKYLDDTMTYYARRYYGRDQTAQIVVNGRELSPTN